MTTEPTDEELYGLFWRVIHSVDVGVLKMETASVMVEETIQSHVDPKRAAVLFLMAEERYTEKEQKMVKSMERQRDLEIHTFHPSMLKYDDSFIKPYMLWENNQCR